MFVAQSSIWRYDYDDDNDVHLLIVNRQQYEHLFGFGCLPWMMYDVHVDVISSAAVILAKRGISPEITAG